MGIFGAKKRGEVLDLSRDYHQTHRTPKVEKELDLTKKEEPSVQPQTSSFPFFFGGGNTAPVSTESSSSDNLESEDSSEERRKKLAKRLVDMTNRIEELDNKLYHLQQRIEVLEKKDGTSGYESNGLGF